ncbi:dihydrolipoamide acetyltransferase family protein [Piscinibacter terrae]|uniref:Dihydrolipoamide acetyltransferase component of pyruvate dehydrogenase complex n=1 Tax=Piscinibacter terrae TaxID=2496871 RepID=A0A3N7JTB7_9BURK|nr:dihydrolipoamide acetyltransferase family protein [Albitalea terrae]RQP24189.1 2-oxo acid dehydrogenase subunit E2 [Albitalea terrae]
MGVHTIKMPDIGEGIAEVELVAWHVKPGDVVKEDQVLADVMTDKANVEIPSPVNGTVLSLGGNVGQVLAVGSPLIQIEVAEMAEAGAVARAERAGVMEAASSNRPSPTREAQAVAPPVERPAPARPREASDAQRHDRPIASPSVRRRAWELGVELERVLGTGAGGRIMHGDLEVHVAKHGSTLPKPEAHSSAAKREPAVTVTTTPSYAPNHEQQQIPIIGVRRKIAQKMQESKRRIPHFSYVEEIDVTDVETLRVQLNERFGQQRGKLTMLPFIARAMVIALRDFPQINARFDDDAGMVTRYGAAHIGIATQTDSGLMVPVMRHAESLDLWGMAREINRLAQASRAGKVTRDELTGSTITISSLGALGGVASTPVINHPEVAIVGVNRIVERPAYRHNTIVPRKLMNLSSSFDHRVVDGVDAAKFIQAVRSLLEVPTGLFVD